MVLIVPAGSVRFGTACAALVRAPRPAPPAMSAATRAATPRAGRSRRFDDGAALGEHNWLDLVPGGRPRFTGFIAEDPPHPHPVGYAHLSAEGDGPPPYWGLEVVVDPEHRGIGVEVALVEAALEHATE